MANIYKPRYKIICKLKSKLWPYKNSRLRKWLDRRGTVVLRKGYWHRRYLLFKNFKWLENRKNFFKKAYRRKRKKQRFKTDLLTKQRLQIFYGKFDATKFKNLFYIYYSKKRFNKMQYFLMHLEQRLDVVFFRLRFLPTIVACHHFIKNNGVLVNNNIITYPYTKIKSNDIISVSKNFWFYFWFIFQKKILNRLIRTFSQYKRTQKLYKKLKLAWKTNWFLKKKRKKNLKLWYTLFFKKNTSFFQNKNLNIKSTLSLKQILEKKKTQAFLNKKNIKARILNKSYTFNKKINLESELINSFFDKINFIEKNKTTFLIHKIKSIDFLIEMQDLTKKFSNYEIVNENWSYKWMFFQLNLQIEKLKYNIKKNSFFNNKNEVFFFKNILKKKILFLIYNLKIKPEKIQFFFKKLLKNFNFFVETLAFVKDFITINNSNEILEKNNFIVNFSWKNIPTYFLKKKQNYSVWKNIFSLIEKVNLNLNFLSLYKNNSITKKLDKKNKAITFYKKKVNASMKKKYFFFFEKINLKLRGKNTQLKHLFFKSKKTNFPINLKKNVTLNLNFFKENLYLKKNIFLIKQHLMFLIKMLLNEIEVKKINIYINTLYADNEKFNFLSKVTHKEELLHFFMKPFLILIENTKKNNIAWTGLITLLKKWFTKETNISEKKNNYLQYIISFLKYTAHELKKKNEQLLFSYQQNLISGKNFFLIKNKHFLNSIFSRRFLIKKKMYTLFKKRKKNRNFKKKFYFFKLKKLLLKKTKRKKYKKKNKGFFAKQHWILPNNYVFDFKTLRGGFFKNITIKEINYPFYYTIREIIAFYKERGF